MKRLKRLIDHYYLTAMFFTLLFSFRYKDLFGFIDMLSTYIFNPKEYTHRRTEYIKYKDFTKNVWGVHL